MRIVNDKTGQEMELSSDGKSWVPVKSSFGDTALGALEQFAQGASLGFVDEARNALTAGLGVGAGQTFSERFKSLQAEDLAERKAFQQEHPILGTAGTIAGIVPTAIATAPLAAGRGLAGLAGLGAIEGGIAGAGGAETLQDVPKEALTGAAIGGVAAPIIPAVGQGLKGLQRVLRPTAAQKLQQTAQNIGVTPQQVGQQISGFGPQGTLADISEGFTGLAQGVAGKSPAARQIAKEGLTPRLEGLSSRLSKKVQEVTGKTSTLFDDLEGLRVARSQKASPLYESAFSNPIGKTPATQSAVVKDLNELLKTNAVQKALPNAKGIASNEGIELTEDLLKTGDLRMWHLVKEGIDDQLGSSAAVNEFGKMNSLGRSITQVKSKLLKVLNKSEDYNKARELFAGDSAMINAAQEGANILKPGKSVGEIRSLVKGFSSGEKDAFLSGATDAIQNKIGNVAEDTAASANFIRPPNVKQKLKTLISDSDFNKLAKFVDKEITQRRTQQAVVGGSQTQLRQAAQRSVDSGVVSQDATQRGIFDRLLESVQGISNREAEKLTRLLATPDGAQEAIKILQAKNVGTKKLESILNSAGLSSALALESQVQ